MGVRKVKVPERSFVLRLPEDQATALKELVDHGLEKSMNGLIVKIIGAFLTDLKKRAHQMPKYNSGSSLSALIGLAIVIVGAAVVIKIIDNATKKRKAICPSCKVDLPFKVERCPSCGILLRW